MDINNSLKQIDKPVEDIAHDLALLAVKSQIDSGKRTMLGEIFEEYAQQYHDFKRVISGYMDENVK